MACEHFIPWKPHAATLTVVESWQKRVTKHGREIT
jgi:hypothetical protein